jgi:hypothetical protein
MLLIAAAFATGCRETVTEVGPTKPPPAVFFATDDQTTGVRAVSIWVTDSGFDVPQDLVSRIAAQVRVSTWPGDVEVPSTSTITTIPGEQLPGGGLRFAHGQIDQELDATLDGSGWYAVSVAQKPGDYPFQNEAVLFSFDGRSFGVRVSPAHPPAVASVLACAKEGGVVAVYARFSELVNKAAGAVAVDYGNAAVTCPAGDEAPGEDQFLCADATAGQPFSVRIVGAVTAQSSGLPLATGTLRSADMQVSVMSDGCRLYKPAITGA